MLVAEIGVIHWCNTIEPEKDYDPFGWSACGWHWRGIAPAQNLEIRCRTRAARPCPTLLSRACAISRCHRWSHWIHRRSAHRSGDRKEV